MTIRTRVALHTLGENFYFGHRTLQELLGEETMTGLMGMAVMGRRPSRVEREVLDAIALAMNSADPRIWPLKATRLLASYGGTVAGFAGGQLPLEGKRIGPWVVGHAARELVLLDEAVARHGDDPDALRRAIADHVREKRHIIGFGVPLRARDERLDPFRWQVEKLGRHQLPFWRLQELLSAEMLRQGRAAPNHAIAVAAALLDMGLAPQQASAITFFINQNVFAANAYEAACQCEPSMQTLPEECVAYAGKPPRSSPLAAERDDDIAAQW
jgi:hypothetical protein